MTRSPSSTLLAELQNPTSPSNLNSALVALKNELIGHEQRKKVWIEYGIVPILTHILENRRGDTGKRSSRNYKDAPTTEGNPTLTEDDTACIHATVITGNIAQAGSAFVAPVLASSILPRLAYILSTPNCPLQLTTAILKTLITVADRLPPQYPNEWPVDRQLAATIYSNEHIATLSSLLNQSSPLSSVQHVIALTARLISKTCTEEAYKTACVEAGILDILASQLASFIVSQGFVLPGAESFIHEPGSMGVLPPSAPPKAQLGPILQCISIIIDQSSSRTEQLLASPAIVTVFPKSRPEFASADIKRAPFPNNPWLSGSAVPQYSRLNPIDSLLPAIPGTEPKHSNPSFPPLRPSKFYSRNSSFMSLDLEGLSGSVETGEEDENAIVSWLIWLIRSDKSIFVRLRGAKILINLFRLGFVKKDRLPMLSMLLIPMLVGILERDIDVSAEPNDGDILPPQLHVKEEAPHLLANLVMDSPELQKAAVDAHAIKTLANLLKRTFDPVADQSKGMWSPLKTPKTPRNRPEPETSLGSSGPTPMARHLMRFREGVLMALASIAPFKDDYRKSICDQGVIPFIVDSLRPYTTFPHLSDNGPDGPHMIPGNPTPTLLAACNAARTLTRSVSMLRTSLNDANVAPPIFTLLKNKDIEVQIAATTVVCNLALDFSPMKAAVVTNGVMKTLCEHAHASHARLRLESIWALKHLVYNSTIDVKIKVLEELGVGWIMSILSNDSFTDNKGIEDSGRIPLSGLGNTDSSGEPINFLNPKNESSEDVSMTEAPVNQGLENFKTHASERQRARGEPESPHTQQTQTFNIAIQEQLLELIRNIICGPSSPDMVDYLFREIGQEDFFSTLQEKLCPKPTTATTSPTRSKTRSNLNASSSNSNPPSIQPVEILIACTYIIVHLAASEPRHRRILITQTDLLRSIIPLFNHPNRVIRVNCCWIVINLTYEDDASDKILCRQRARELEKLEVREKLAGLLDDDDLDVRERTKTAWNIMNGLLTH